MGTDEILAKLLIDIGILLGVSQVLRLVLRKLHQPDVIAYVLAGFVLGPSLLGNLPSDPSAFLFPETVRSALSMIGSLGLVVFAFAIGLGLDIKAVRRQSRAVLEVSVGALAAPLAAGAALALVLYPAHRMVDGSEVPKLAFVLFLATAMAVTAFPVLVAIVTERGIGDLPLGRLAVSSAAVQDAVGWVLLAAALAAFSGGGSGPTRIAPRRSPFSPPLPSRVRSCGPRSTTRRWADPEVGPAPWRSRWASQPPVPVRPRRSDSTSSSERSPPVSSSLAIGRASRSRIWSPRSCL